LAAFFFAIVSPPSRWDRVSGMLVAVVRAVKPKIPYTVLPKPRRPYI